LIRTVIIEVLSMVALAFAIQVMLEATVSIATEIRALVMDVLRRMELAGVIRVGPAPIAPSKLRCHALQVRMGILTRYAADTALLVVPILRDRRRVLVLASAIVWTHMRAITVSIATEIRALVMELLRRMELAGVIRVGGVIVVIVRKAMRARMDQMTNRANMEHLVETFQPVHVIVQGQITKENIAIRSGRARLDQMANRAKMEEDLQGI
jgi:uncharacterized membrane protein